jgi:hypothetical protein
MLLSFRKFGLPHLCIIYNQDDYFLINTKRNKELKLTNKKLVNNLNDLYKDFHNYSLEKQDLEFILTVCIMVMEGVI